MPAPANGNPGPQSWLAPPEPASDSETGPRDGPPVRRRNWRSGVLYAVAVAVVVVGVVVGLALTGEFSPGSRSLPGTTVAGTESFVTADGLATAFAVSAPGGPWTFNSATGWGLTDAYTFTGIPAIGPGCTLTGGTDALPIATQGGNYSDGLFSAWGFAYANSTRTSLLIVEVSDGRASEVGHVVAGTSCHFPFPPLGSLGAASLDSPQIAQKVYADPVVSSYLRNHTTSNASFTLEWAESGVGPSWTATFTTCNPLDPASGGPTIGPSATVQFNATTGVRITNASTPLLAGCARPAPATLPYLPGNFTAGDPVLSTCPAGDTYASNGCLGGDYVYSLPILSSNATFGGVAFRVPSAGFGEVVVEGVGGFSILNASDDLVAQSIPLKTLLMLDDFTPLPATQMDRSSPLSTVFTIVIDMGSTSPAGQGYTFVANAVGSFQGSTAPLALP